MMQAAPVPGSITSSTTHYSLPASGVTKNSLSTPQSQMTRSPARTLLDAMASGRWNETRGLIRSHVDVNATNAFGQTALHLANDPGVIDALLRFGAKQDIVDDLGNIPILAAMERGDHDAQHLMMKSKYQTVHGISART